MTLKNRDGSPYKLRGPNPLMKEQTTWEDFIVHNMKFAGQLAPDEQVVETLNSDFKVKDDFTSVLEQTKPEIQVVEPPTQTKQVAEPIQKKSIEVDESKAAETALGVNLPPGVKKTFTYCLPAIMRERRDNIYGDKYQTIQYGKPFSCEVVIVKEEDLFIEMWTNVPQVSKGSIIYPKQGIRDSQRWWRIQEKVEKTGGWLLTGCISDYTPAFNQV